MKFRDCTSMNSTENIQEGYRNGLSKTALEFKNCKQQLFTLTMCLPACLWTQIAKTPFNYAITAETLLAIRDDYLQFPALEKKISYRKHGHHNLSSKYASRCREKREWLRYETDRFLFFVSYQIIFRLAHNCHDTRNNFGAKESTARQKKRTHGEKEKTHGKRKNIPAKRKNEKTSRQN